MGRKSQNGKKRQALYDAIKLAREQGESEFIFNDGKYKLLNPHTEENNCLMGDCLVKLGNRIIKGWLSDKDGLRFTTETSSCRIQEKQIMAYLKKSN